MKVVVVGAGAIGCCVAAWLSPHVDSLHVLARGKTADALKNHGVKAFQYDAEENSSSVKIDVIESISEQPAPDLVIIAVKNYDLDEIAGTVKKHLKSSPIVVGLQNGMENQEILPRYFDKVVYGVIAFNANRFEDRWRVGYKDRGPIIIGTPDNSLQDEIALVQETFSKGFACEPTDKLIDAVLCKMAVNLVNTVSTLLGYGIREIESMKIYKDIVANTVYEGVKVLKATGRQEVALGDMPTWKTLKMAVTLPGFITIPVFKKNMKKMRMSSMAQDVFSFDTAGRTEIDSLTGYFLEMGKEAGVPMPYNETVYELAKKAFSAPGFKGISEKEVLAAVKAREGEE